MDSAQEIVLALLHLFVNGEYVMVYGATVFLIVTTLRWRTAWLSYLFLFHRLSRALKFLFIGGLTLLMLWYSCGGPAWSAGTPQPPPLATTPSSRFAGTTSRTTSTSTGLWPTPSGMRIPPPTAQTISTSRTPAAPAEPGRICVDEVSPQWDFDVERDAIRSLGKDVAGISYAPLTAKTEQFVEGALTLVDVTQAVREQYQTMRESNVPLFLHAARVALATPDMHREARSRQNAIHAGMADMARKSRQCEEQRDRVMGVNKSSKKNILDQSMRGTIRQLQEEKATRSIYGARRRRGEWPKALTNEEVEAALARAWSAHSTLELLVSAQGMDGCIADQVALVRRDWQRCVLDQPDRLGGEVVQALEEARLEWAILPIGKAHASTFAHA